MAINPPSDIVLDVLKAADPVRAQATTQRLAALGAPDGAAADEFADALEAAQHAPVAKPAPAASAAGMRDRLSAASPGAAEQKAARVEVDFEASMLKTFVDAMLPKNETDVYGQGSAGDIWKSMLADQIARQIAKSGAFGISQRLFATHPLPGQARLESPNPAPFGVTAGLAIGARAAATGEAADALFLAGPRS